MTNLGARNAELNTVDLTSRLARSGEGPSEDNIPFSRQHACKRPWVGRPASIRPRASSVIFPADDESVRCDVFGIAGRRVAEAVVALFALLGFAYVPLGRKTALEHTLGIFTTPAAIDAWHELSEATSRLREKLLASLVQPRVSAPPIEAKGARPDVPALPPKKLH